jgi:hypothetical protein
MSTSISTPTTATGEFAAVMGTPRKLPDLSNVFRPKFGIPKASTSSATVLTASVERAVGAADQLVDSYKKLRVEVLDRSDRAVWEMQEQVYAFVQQVDSSAQKRETRNELIRKIQVRDSQGVTSNASTEAVIVRYVFVDQSRQTRNNYTIAMEKARALDIPVNGYADFLAKNGGVGGVVERVFDHEAEEQATAKQMADAKAADKGTRTHLVTRLYSALAHKAESELAYAGEVTDWVPQDPKADTTKSKIGAKPDPRYEKGNFVFFVTLQNPETGGYRVVHGSVFDQAYEQQLLASIAERMDVSIPELSTTVQGLEQSIGFGALEANDFEELKKA